MLSSLELWFVGSQQCTRRASPNHNVQSTLAVIHGRETAKQINPYVHALPIWRRYADQATLYWAQALHTAHFVGAAGGFAKKLTKYARAL